MTGCINNAIQVSIILCCDPRSFPGPRRASHHLQNYMVLQVMGSLARVWEQGYSYIVQHLYKTVVQTMHLAIGVYLLKLPSTGRGVGAIPYSKPLTCFANSALCSMHQSYFGRIGRYHESHMKLQMCSHVLALWFGQCL